MGLSAAVGLMSAVAGLMLVDVGLMVAGALGGGVNGGGDRGDNGSSSDIRANGHSLWWHGLWLSINILSKIVISDCL